MIEWRTIPGLEGFYEASDVGDIRSVDRVSGGKRWKGRVLSQCKAKYYRSVHIALEGVHKVHNVHILVAAAFHGARPEDSVIRHLNGLRHDNRASNLCYGSRSENTADMDTHGTLVHGDAASWRVIDSQTARRVAALRNTLSQQKIADALGVKRHVVQCILSGKTWRRVTGISKRN